MTVKETLIQARALIADPANWKQGGLATISEANEITGPFCAIGAIGRVNEVWSVGPGGGSRTGQGGTFFTSAQERNFGNAEARASFDAAKAVLTECLPAPIHDYSDSHDHACILAAFDAAIEKVTKEETCKSSV